MDKNKEIEMVAFLGIGGERLDEIGQKAVDLGMTVEEMNEFTQLAIACTAVVWLADDPNATLEGMYDVFGATWLERLGVDE